MSDDPNRQASQHVEGLRASGVEWVAKPNKPAAPDPASSPAKQASLFGEEPSAADSMSLEQRKHALTVLAETVSKCSLCPELYSTRTQTVFADGQAGAEVCFVGEAPGYNEDKQGVPFVGRAGELLDKIIVASGFRREDVYICNTIKCRPPNNRDPLPEEAKNCSEYFREQIELVAPKFIVALGRVGAQNLLGVKTPLGKLRGNFHDYRGTPVLVTYHPASLLRNPAQKRDVWDDMKMLLREMGRPIPSPGSGRGG